MRNCRLKLSTHIRIPARVIPSRWRSLLFLIAVALFVIASPTQTAHASPPAQTAPQANPASSESPHGVYLPHLSAGAAITRTECPSVSNAQFRGIPVAGPPTDRPPRLHADLNLSVRGYTSVALSPALVRIDGPADADAPQLAALSNAAAHLNFVGTHRVRDWDWLCGNEHGCPSAPIMSPPVTLLAVAAQPGISVHTPARQAEIYAGGYVALVLYAESRRITLAYTREDTAAVGYVIHIEDVCIDPALLALYRRLNNEGRSQLPALRSLQQLGTGSTAPLKVAVRDTGSFMDPRSRKDWWKEQ